MFFSHMLGNPYLSPLRLISTIVLGRPAAMPGYQAIPSSLVVGFVIHYLLSILLGIITTSIAVLLGRRAALGRGWTFLILGVLGGLVIWVVDFYAIAPALFPQFGMVNPLWNGFVAHVIFGFVLGLYLTTRMQDFLMRNDRAPSI